MNPLLLMAHWGVGEVLLAIAILALLFGDRRTWEVLKRLAQTLRTRLRSFRPKTTHH